MKKLYSLMLAGLVLAAPTAAMAMDSAELLSHPAKYRVIAAGEDEVVYADLSTLTAIQTMDFPNSVENMHFKMYVESYRDKVNAMDFARDNLVTSIREFDAGLYVNKNTKSYNLETRLAAVYDAKGEAVKTLDPKEAKEAEKLRVKADGPLYEPQPHDPHAAEIRPRHGGTAGGAGPAGKQAGRSAAADRLRARSERRAHPADRHGGARRSGRTRGGITAYQAESSSHGLLFSWAISGDGRGGFHFSFFTVLACSRTWRMPLPLRLPAPRTTWLPSKPSTKERVFFTGGKEFLSNNE